VTRPPPQGRSRTEEIEPVAAVIIALAISSTADLPTLK